MSDMKKWLYLMESSAPIIEKNQTCTECGMGSYAPMEEGMCCTECGHMPMTAAPVEEGMSCTECGTGSYTTMEEGMSCTECGHTPSASTVATMPLVGGEMDEDAPGLALTGLGAAAGAALGGPLGAAVGGGLGSAIGNQVSDAKGKLASAAPVLAKLEETCPSCNKKPCICEVSVKELTPQEAELVAHTLSLIRDSINRFQTHKMTPEDQEEMEQAQSFLLNLMGNPENFLKLRRANIDEKLIRDLIEKLALITAPEQDVTVHESSKESIEIGEKVEQIDESSAQSIVDDLKSRGEYYEAGVKAFENGLGRKYGQHFGVRRASTDIAKAEAEFHRGYDQAEAKSKKVNESAGKILRDWNVLYDSAHAKNVRARLKMNNSMDEAAVREWFSKTFQPLKIYEVGPEAGEPFDPNKTGKFPAFSGRPSGSMEPKKYNSRNFKFPITVKFYFTANPKEIQKKRFEIGEEDAYKVWIAKAKEDTKIKIIGVRDSRGSDTGVYGEDIVVTPNKTGSSSPMPPKTPQTGGALGSKTTPGGLVSPNGNISLRTGDTLKTKDGKEVVVADREHRDEIDMDEVMSAVHAELKGNYDLAAQKKAIHRIARRMGMHYKTILGAWVKREDGAMKAINAVKASEEPSTDMQTPPATPTPPAAAPPVMETKSVAKTRKNKQSLGVNESHHLQLEVDDHHEVRMAQAELYKAVKCATELHKMMDKMTELEGWVQAKITLAADYIETVKDHLEYELARTSHEMHSGYETPPSLEVFENKKKKK